MQNELRDKEQIIYLIKKNNQKIKSFGVSKIGLFGSFVHEQQTIKSDIDILVEFETGKKTYDSFIKLAFFLEDLFGRKVDLLSEKSLSPYIGTHILNETEYVALSS